MTARIVFSEYAQLFSEPDFMYISFAAATSVSAGMVIHLVLGIIKPLIEEAGKSISDFPSCLMERGGTTMSVPHLAHPDWDP